MDKKLINYIQRRWSSQDLYTGDETKKKGNTSIRVRKGEFSFYLTDKSMLQEQIYDKENKRERGKEKKM